MRQPLPDKLLAEWVRDALTSRTRVLREGLGPPVSPGTHVELAHLQAQLIAQNAARQMPWVTDALATLLTTIEQQGGRACQRPPSNPTSSSSVRVAPSC